MRTTHSLVPSGRVLGLSLVSLLLTATAAVALPSAPVTDSSAAYVRASETYGKLPLFFEANRGQTDPRVKFLSRIAGHTLFLTSAEAVLVFTKREQPEKREGHDPKAKQERLGSGTRTVLRMRFVGANPNARIKGQEELPGKANYFLGNEPAKWRTNVPTYARVHYQDLYPGIDLIYYGKQRQLEYDFVVRPGADAKEIVLAFQGHDGLEVDAHGELVLHTAAGPIRQRKPDIYQEVSGVRKKISGGYVLMGTHQIGFRVAAYDPSRPLIIDPVLFYSTYLGGSGHDEGWGIAVDISGNSYVTGWTESADFPTANALQTTNAGGTDAFVAKFNPTGSALVYSTYLGGNDAAELHGDSGTGIAVDAAGNAYIAGSTTSTNFPTTPGAFQTTFGACCGSIRAFVTKLNATGSALVYSTYLGGSGARDDPHDIAVDSAGNAYVTGETNSPDFPTTPGAFQTTYGGQGDAYVTKLSASGAALVYSTYLGGNAGDEGDSIRVDAAGNAYVAGQTYSVNFPTTPGAFQSVHGGSDDAFVTKLNATGSTLLYSTYLGGSGLDAALGIAVDAAGNAYVTGLTDSTNFPTTLGAFQTALRGSLFDVFVTKVNAFGTALIYSTYLGGSGDDLGIGIAVDSPGNAYVAGRTTSSDFPTINAVQAVFGGVADAFVAKMNQFGSGLVYSTYLGGASFEEVRRIAVDALPNPNAYVTGRSDSTDFPTTSGAFQTTIGGGRDAFVAKITDIVLPPPPTVGKVTGGGSINVSGGIGTFGFIVQRQAADASIHGDVQYVNHANAAKVHSVMFTTFLISGNTTTFGGTCTNNGVPCTFTVKAIDNGEPGTNDHFTITVDGGPAEGDKLRSGSILIHR